MSPLLHVIIIDINKILAREKEQATKPKPLPKVAFKTSSQKSEVSSKKAVTSDRHPDNYREATGNLLAPLEAEYHKILKERKILSTHTHRLVADITKHLAMESPGMVKEFVEGRLGMPEIKEHYAKIQDKSDRLLDLFDKMEHVKRYGTMPVHTPPTVSIVKIMDSPEAAQLRYEIRRLDDYIYKRVKYLEKCKSGLKVPRNTDTVNRKKMEIALAEARRNDCKSKIKRIQYEQRVG